MKYQSKEALITDIHTQHDLLCARLHDVPNSRRCEPGVWGDDWTVTDLIAHLAEWQFMFLTWYQDGLSDVMPQMPAPGYKWNETPRLNHAIWARHRSRSATEVRAGFDGGFKRILEIVKSLSSEQLLQPGHFRWTGENSLATYLAPNTASHYRFALKVVKRWLKGGAARNASVARNKHVQRATARRAVRALQTGRVVT